MSDPAKLVAGTLPDQKWTSFQQLYQEMFRLGQITFPGGTLAYTISSTTPGASDRDKLWVKVDGSGNPIGHFVFSGSSWVWPHEIPANDKRYFRFSGAVGEITTLDGGSSGTVTSTTGPFWEQVTSATVSSGAEYAQILRTASTDTTSVSVTDINGSTTNLTGQLTLGTHVFAYNALDTTITPTAEDSTLDIVVEVQVTPPGSAVPHLILALFEDLDGASPSTNPIATVVKTLDSVHYGTLRLNYSLSANSTTGRTYKLALGADAGGSSMGSPNIVVNGNVFSNPVNDGTLVSSMTVWERPTTTTSELLIKRTAREYYVG